jgi:hypothetical protein
MNDKRQKNQLQMALAFTEEGRSEAPRAPREGTESYTAKCETESPAREGQLMEEVCGRENCQQALRRVKANKGSPGIDGMKVSELPGYLKQHWPALREQLLNGTYKPQPVKRVEIKKPDGGMRKLGIPTVLDRFVQQAVMQVLQRRWDPTFSEHSHGFRPQRSAHQAVAKAQQYIAAGNRWVVDLDLEKFFDRVNHDKLMAAMARRVSDKRMLKLIRAFLESGVMENGLVSPVEEGTPQGGPSTPLTQKVIFSSSEQLRDGELGTRYLIFALRGNTLMSHGTLHQDGKGSASERCSCSAPPSSCASRSCTEVVTRLRFVRAASISLFGRSLPARSASRSSRSYRAHHVETSPADSGTAPEVCAKQWLDHRSDRNGRVACVSAHSEKAWLSRLEKAAHFKSTFPIRLIACSSQSSRRLTTFWCPVASAPSACA